MRYVLLIYGSEAAAAGMTQEEHTALMQGHGAFAQEALQRSLLTGGAPLQPASTATTVATIEDDLNLLRITARNHALEQKFRVS